MCDREEDILEEERCGERRGRAEERRAGRDNVEQGGEEMRVEAELRSFFYACQMRNGYLAPCAIIKTAGEKIEANVGGNKRVCCSAVAIDDVCGRCTT